MAFGKKVTKGISAAVMTGMLFLAVGLVVSVPILMLGSAASTPVTVGNVTYAISVPPMWYYFSLALPFIMFAIGFAAPISIITSEADKKE